MLRIATWNVERPKRSEATRRDRLLKAIQSVQADIWILTETHTSISLGPDFTAVSTQQADRAHESGESWMAIWSRFPMELAAPTSDPCRAISVRIMPEGGRSLIVYGTVLPWLGSPWQEIPAAGGAAFSAVLSAQCADWLSLQQENPDCDFILAGDFNQDLGTSHYYGSKQNRLALQSAIPLEGFAIATAKLRCLSAAALDPVPKHAPSNASIDHICVSKGLHPVGCSISWPTTEKPQKGLSDHFGVLAELASV
jgi:endonuclease/exonuclease/phosphatase family metal-dependent hydrolase